MRHRSSLAVFGGRPPRPFSTLRVFGLLWMMVGVAGCGDEGATGCQSNEECGDTGNECTASICDLEAGECGAVDVDDGTACADGAGMCTSGMCEIDRTPEPQTVQGSVNCTVPVAGDVELPLVFTAEPQGEILGGQSVDIVTILSTDVAEELGQTLIDLMAANSVSIAEAEFTLGVTGATPSTFENVSTAVPFVLNVDPDEDEMADPVTIALDATTTTLNVDGSDTLEISVQGMNVLLSDVPLLMTLRLPSSMEDGDAIDIPCVIDAPTISFDVN